MTDITLFPIQLWNFSLINLEQHINDISYVEYFNGINPEKKEKPTIEFNYRIKREKLYNDKFVGSLVCFKMKASTGENNIFSINLDLLGIFKILHEVSDEQLEYFLEQNSVSLLWPYLREILQGLTIKMGMPAYVLPTILISNPTKEINQKSKEEE